MDHIVFISANYPSSARPAAGRFVQQIVHAIADKGVKCSTISPISVFDMMRYGENEPKVKTYRTTGANHIRVIRPKYLSVSNKKLLSYNTALLTQRNFERAIERSMSILDAPPSILYGHFLYHGGCAAVSIASKLGVPSVVAVGDSSFSSVKSVGLQRFASDFNRVGGVICVSTLIRDTLVNDFMVPEEKVCMLPNGVDLSKFYPRDRLEMRRKYGFPGDKFIVAFNGHFSERKGPHRLAEAASGVGNIGLIFIGAGNVAPSGNNILFQGNLEHETVPEVLSAADIFVLPTLSEGSCNSIIEALACGLPVVTSKGRFNDDIVDSDVAIRINPRNIDEIRSAICTLYDNEKLRAKMSVLALNKAKQYDLNKRASNILEWMAKVSENYFVPTLPY